MSDRLLLAAGAVLGVPAILVGYVVLVELVLRLAPERRRPAVRPWLWIAPAVAFIGTFLAYPAVRTVTLSFRDARSERWVGLDNYRFVFTDGGMLTALRNNALWLVLFTALTVGFGLLIAILTDRVRYEPVAKAVIFMPMAISLVAAGVIWRFMYNFRPPGSPQNGTVNAALGSVVPGFEPHAWLIDPPGNNIALIIAAAWIWTGFCMVVISAALKGIPRDLFEAARVDGAGEWQTFRAIVLPLLAPTLTVVTTVMLITALKAFDIVYVMTSGNFDTDVIANRMYKEMFNVRNYGRASAIAVLLLVAILPVMLLNMRRFRGEGAVRA